MSIQVKADSVRNHDGHGQSHGSHIEWAEQEVSELESGAQSGAGTRPEQEQGRSRTRNGAEARARQEVAKAYGVCYR